MKTLIYSQEDLDLILSLKTEEKDNEIERLNNIIIEYKTNTIPTLEHNIDCLVDNEERLNNIINECADEILKELQENHHLSYGVALAIRQKLINYRELKESDNNE